MQQQKRTPRFDVIQSPDISKILLGKKRQDGTSKLLNLEQLSKSLTYSHAYKNTKEGNWRYVRVCCNNVIIINYLMHDTLGLMQEYADEETVNNIEQILNKQVEPVSCNSLTLMINLEIMAMMQTE